MRRDKVNPFWANDPVGRQIKIENVTKSIESAVRNAQMIGMANTPFIQLCQMIWHREIGEHWGVILDKEEGRGK